MLTFKNTESLYLILYCTFLSFFLPFTLWRINSILHQKGDPPWKKEDKSKVEKVPIGHNKNKKKE